MLHKNTSIATIMQIKKCLILCTVILFSGFAHAQSVGLVLSGGGAKRLAHIGVIKALEELKEENPLREYVEKGKFLDNEIKSLEGKLMREQILEEGLRADGRKCNEIRDITCEVGIIPRCHFEDATRADFYGFVVPFAHELMKVAEESKSVIKIRVCDTLGLGVPYPGVAMPRSVPGLIHGLAYYAGVPSEWMEWHGHNDLNLVNANAVTAWLYGCSAANGTMLGIGERTGNPSIEGLVMSYLQLRGNDCGVDTMVITEIAEYFEKELQKNVFEKLNFAIKPGGLFVLGKSEVLPVQFMSNYREIKKSSRVYRKELRK